MWNEIQNEAAIKHLMEAVDCFHDSCIKEIRYVSGAYVGDDLSMRPVNDQRQLSVIFQRQSETFSMIEIVFSGLRYLYLAPVSERYSCEIHDAAFFFKDGTFTGATATTALRQTETAATERPFAPKAAAGGKSAAAWETHRILRNWTEHNKTIYIYEGVSCHEHRP